MGLWVPSSKRERLNGKITRALRALLGSEAQLHDDRFFNVYRTCKIDGVSYADSAKSSNDSIVCFKPNPCTSAEYVPAVIVSIFSLDTTVHELPGLFFAVSSYLPSSLNLDTMQNPFLRYPDFQASLWSMDFEGITVVRADQIIGHALRRPWCSGVYVFRPLTRMF